MSEEKEEIQYYDIDKTLSRQRIFNFTLGARGCGKTYAAKVRAVKNFLSKGKQFVYIRRYETEIPQAEMRNFFDDIADQFDGVEFSSYNGLFRINKKVAGWYIALSKATMLKSVPFPNVSLIIFDEFIIEVGVHRYLPNEVRTFLECYSTISRDRDVPVVFLSNSISQTNPYFIYFDITMQEGQTLKLTPFICVEYLSLKSFTEHVRNTKFGQLISNTAYGDYAIENKFLLDTNDFVAKLPANCKYLCTFIINSSKMGYYSDPQNGTYYISSKIDPTCERVYALNIDEHVNGTKLAARNNIYIVSAVQSFSNGDLRFTSIKIKNIVTPILKKYL